MEFSGTDKQRTRLQIKDRFAEQAFEKFQNIAQKLRTVLENPGWMVTLCYGK